MTENIYSHRTLKKHGIVPSRFIPFIYWYPHLNTLEGKGHKWHSDTWELNGISHLIFRCLNATYALFPLRYSFSLNIECKNIATWLAWLAYYKSVIYLSECTRDTILQLSDLFVRVYKRYSKTKVQLLPGSWEPVTRTSLLFSAIIYD